MLMENEVADIIYNEFNYYVQQNINIDIEEEGVYNVTIICEENDDFDTIFLINLNIKTIKMEVKY